MNRAFILAATTALISVPALSLAATKVGVIGAANPQVFVLRGDAGKQELKVGDAIYLNDELTTNGKGSAQLMFLDKSALTISPESAVTIDEFVYDPRAKDGTMTVNGAKGAFRFIGGALTKKKAVKLKTPVSTIGIRGGIVDTHIAASGKTDAVFLFGKEMTMTNAAGVTTSTNQFGSGLGLTTANAAPINLPQNIVAARINASPTQAAVAAAPPAPPAQLNALESKVDTGAAVKAAPEPVGGGSSAPAPQNAPAGGSSNESSDGGNSDNSGGDNNGGSNANAGPSNNGPAERGPASTNGGNGNTSQAAAEPPAGGPAGNAAPTPAGDGPAPVAQAPSPAPAIGGLAEGAGLKPIPAADIPLDTANVGSEQLYAEVDNFVASGGDADGDGRADFDISGVDVSQIQQVEGRGGLRKGQSNGVSFFEPNSGEAQEEQLNGPVITRDEPIIDPEPDPEPPQPPIANNNNNTVQPDFFGSTVDWATQAPTLPRAAERRGRLYHRDDAGDNTTGGDDRIEVAELRSFTGVSSDPTRFDGNEVFIAKTKDRFIGDYATAGDTVTAGEARNYIIGALPTLSPGHQALSASEILIEGENGVEQIALNFFGDAYKTNHGSFSYYQLEWDDVNGTPTNPSDDLHQHARGYILNSPLFSDVSVIDATTAQTAYDAMLNQSASSSEAINGIIEYDFLPELSVGIDSSSNLLDYGIFDYNQHLDFDTTSVANSNGLLVDWGNRRFIGGYVSFASGAPIIETMFGEVNDASTASITWTDPASGGIGGSGEGLSGAYYNLRQDVTFNDSGRKSLGITAAAENFASNGGSSSPIEALVVEGVQGGNHVAEQAVVIGDGATAALLSNNVSTKAYKGMSAGLMIAEDPTAANPNLVTRISTHPTSLLNVNIHGDGSADATLVYREKDTTGAGTQFDGGDQIHDINFTDSGAALQTDLYAAEVTTHSGHAPGDLTKGVLVSMHEAIAPTRLNASSEVIDGRDLVCSSCNFAHWGVWQADHISTNDPIQKSMLVPYVAGDMTTAAQLNDIANNQNPGVVNYTGDAVANVAVVDHNNSDAVSFMNAAGSMTAAINLSTRSIAAEGLHVDFTDIAGSTRDLSIKNQGSITFTGPTNVFNGAVKTNFTDSSGTASTYINSTGEISGVFFGPGATEIGGNFHVNNGTANESIKAGGVYLGQCNGANSNFSC